MALLWRRTTAASKRLIRNVRVEVLITSQRGASDKRGSLFACPIVAARGLDSTSRFERRAHGSRAATTRRAGRLASMFIDEICPNQ